MDLGGLREITDPIARAKRARQAVREAERIANEAIAEAARNMTQAAIGDALGVTRARISQIVRGTDSASDAAPPPERALLAPDAAAVTICVIEKRDADRGQPTITRTTMTASAQLSALAVSYGTSADVETIPAPGLIDLNRPNLAVLIGPRSSALIAQAISADPVIKWQPDADGDWYIIDTKTGTEYHSQFDRTWRSAQRGSRTCYAHIGRIRRPDGQGSWLCLAGAHAPGVAGAVEFFCREAGSLWDQAHRSTWSAIAEVTTDGRVVESVSLVTPVYVHGRR
jgi:hypothetical protein